MGGLTVGRQSEGSLIRGFNNPILTVTGVLNPGEWSEGPNPNHKFITLGLMNPQIIDMVHYRLIVYTVYHA